MRSRNVYLCIFLIILCKFGHADVKDGSKSKVSNIIYTECWFDLQYFGADAKCGKLHVPEDYSDPGTSVVQLPFIIVLPTRVLDPVPLIVAGGGGPGGGLGISYDDSDYISDLTWAEWSYSVLDSGRPLVLIDNRGVGSSVPNMNCPEVENVWFDILQMDKDSEESHSMEIDSYVECKNRLVNSGIDVNQYNATSAARDINEFRKNYGQEQVYLYGVSYGSRLALLFERLYPDAVKALILDGVYPLGVNSIEDYARLNADMLQRIFDLCEIDYICSERTKDNLSGRFEVFLDKLKIKPIEIQITHDKTLESLDISVTPELLIDTLFSASYSSSDIRFLPLYIESMMSGATDYLSNLVRDHYVWTNAISQFDEAAYFTYGCYGEVPFNSLQVTLSNSRLFPILDTLNSSYYSYEFDLCDAWDFNTANERLKTTHNISSPVLMLSGLLDPVTPPRYAAKLEGMGDNIYHLTWSNISHGVLYASECAQFIMAKFLDNPYLDPDESCRSEENQEVFEFTFY